MLGTSRRTVPSAPQFTDRRCIQRFEERGFMDILRLIFSILLPPLGVFLQVGFGGQFLLNILLTLLGYVPGLIHAVWIIATRR